MRKKYKKRLKKSHWKVFHFFKGLRLPALRWPYRFFLYIIMTVCAVLSTANAALHILPEGVSMVCYGLAALTLFPGCGYLVLDIRRGISERIKPQIAANPYASRIASDYRFRTLMFAFPGFLGNVVFAVFNGFVGLYARSPWFGSLSAYYILLSMMRVSILRQAREIEKMPQREEQLRRETALYQKNSFLFLVMAVVLGGMVILLEAEKGGKTYPGFTIYAAAAYAFYRIIMAVIQMIKVKKEQSPLLMLVRKIGYIDACVSMLTLQTAMFAAFGSGEKYMEKWMNGILGGVICMMVFAMGFHGSWNARKK